ncbi:splicing factor Cactin-like, partial [Achroia grisella]|uniref:splicing factor Cactin-like n=1 Tax=Achroia grisella TaxID=688607 RepID=UPI0027D243E3
SESPERERPVKSEAVAKAEAEDEAGSSEEAEEAAGPSKEAASETSEAEAAEAAETVEAAEAAEAWYSAGRYSPALLCAASLEPGTMLTEPADDLQRLAYLRAALAPQQRAEASDSRSLEQQAARAMSAGGAPAPGDHAAAFSVEHPLPEQPCLWADKYRPRKPRYFNRVHTGFEWNKYNQTHYDMDNPPPKIVQGYKFNIFYPDLINKNATPEFSLKPCPENADFAVLRFHAGPPYEDIAFKIVNREWEYSYKRGFRCHFHNNIFQLWFHFKRYRYRR